MSGIEGRRFSRNYIKRGEPTSDSVNMRLRISSLSQKLEDVRFWRYIQDEMGISAPVQTNFYGWNKWYTDLPLVYFLDAITVFNECLKANGYRSPDWISGVRRIFEEENVSYRIDDLGGVHFSIDGEFEHNQVSALTALSGPRYQAASAHFEAAQAAMDGVPPQTRDAVRHIFECVENLFKLMFPSEAALGVTEVTKKLKPLVQNRAKSDPEKNATAQLVESLKSWVIGAHQYRHASGSETPDNPPIEFAVLNVSMGASFARWLAEIDREINTLADAAA